MNIKYRPLKAFLLAVDTGSFTHAASQLGVTQSSFSVMIQMLESTLGVRLFERSTRAIALTHEGKDFLSRIRRPLADIEEAYSSVQESAVARRDTLILGALPPTVTLIAPALESLHAALPNLRAHVSVTYNEDLLLLLRMHQIECAVATLQKPAPDLVFWPLLEDYTCVVFKTNHPLALQKHITWDDLVHQEMILPSKGSARTQFDDALQMNATTPVEPPRYDVNDLAMAVAFARSGLGVTVLPRLMLPELNLHGVLVRRINSSSARRCIGVVHCCDCSLAPAARRFVGYLGDSIPNIERTLQGFEGDADTGESVSLSENA